MGYPDFHKSRGVFNKIELIQNSGFVNAIGPVTLLDYDGAGEIVWGRSIIINTITDFHALDRIQIYVDTVRVFLGYLLDMGYDKYTANQNHVYPFHYKDNSEVSFNYNIRLPFNSNLLIQYIHNTVNRLDYWFDINIGVY